MNWNWRISRRLRWWTVGIAIAALVAILPGLYIKSQCSAEQPSYPAAYHISVEGEGTKYQSEEGSKTPVTQFSFADAGNGYIREKTRAESTYSPPQEQLDWWTRFLCEINIADYTLAYFTIVLAVSTIGLSYVTWRAVELARDEFISSHRPELVLREVFWTQLTEDKSDVVSFTLINRGQSRGHIIESVLEVRSDNPIVQFITDGKNSFGDITLARGEFCFRQIKVDPFLAGARDLLEEAFLRGVIIYEDDAKIRRRLVICRRAAKGGDRFFSIGDAEYEYTD